MLTSWGGSGGASVDFLGVAASEPAREDLVDRKVCEGAGCGRMFWRRLPQSARHGEKLCEGCRARQQRMNVQDADVPRARRTA